MKRPTIQYLWPVLCSVLVLVACQKEISKPDQQEVLRTGDKSISASGVAGKSISRSSRPNELIVKFKPGTSGDIRTKAFERAGASVKEHLLTRTMQRFGDAEGIYVVHTSSDAALNQFKKMGEIQYVEPNYIMTHQSISNDPNVMQGNCWGLTNVGAEKAWASGHTGASSVYVGVIDEGAMYSHEDLQANFWTNPFEKLDGIDNDGNGYIDDIHGWDFLNNDNSVFDASGDDHGSHVAGTLGAKGGNGIGVAGINWNVTIISAKFLGPDGGTVEDAIKSIDYMTDLKTRHGLNIVATNNSWGGDENSQALKDAITRAGLADILFVAAAGNSSANVDTFAAYPAAYDNDNIISVAASDSYGNLAFFSNRSSTKVDLAAPGVNIFSTVPREVWRGSGKNIKVASGYNYMSGTSMATPHVTGACALYASTHPGVTAAQVKAAILSSVIPTPSLQGTTLSGGHLDISKF